MMYVWIIEKKKTLKQMNANKNKILLKINNRIN